ncbi:sodium-coupled monocarboxylate transporter 1-like [Ctenocephalides felis]|uniref:sodium-coupled monocarboxylate transporter 1-like n=1 Tax=Ctenocephalides felis TaxID=7515 RepID=UPI000E6E557D|nr:sodium-coupled monocarboxylate transporter 1-like [Ctenocephalides felis]
MDNLTNETSSLGAEFGAADYSIFCLMLSLSLSIGVYFGFFGKGADSTDEYLLGGRQMKTIPIAISLVASQLSGISIMSLPAEMYAYGSQFAILLPVMILVTVAVVYIFIPVFYSLNLANAYDYLRMRFDSKVRELICTMFILNLYLVLPIVIFVPALAFAQVTNINIHIINAVVCMICVLYTMLGGIKAVVWTDVMQAGVMVTSCLSVAILGVIRVGGMGEVWRIANEGGRVILFNTDPSLTARTSIWNTATGSFTLWCAYVGLNQSCVQRYVALPSMKHAQKAMWLFLVGFFVIMSLNFYTGFIMYATYHDCDPMKIGIVNKADQLMPHFVSQTVGHIPGMPGVFIACVFSAALSTMSASLNSMSGIIYEDYIRRLNLFEHTERRANLVMKSVVFITGCYCVLGGLVVEQFEHILQIVTVVVGITTGATMGSFTLGMLVPKMGPKGALWGSLVSSALMLWIATGAQIAVLSGRLNYPRLPTSTEGCTGNFTVIDTSPKVVAPEDEPFVLYKLSFNYYCGLGTLVTWLVGLFVSFLFENEDPSTKDRRLYAPCVQRFLPKSTQNQTKSSDKECIKTEEYLRKQSIIALESKLVETSQVPTNNMADVVLQYTKSFKNSLHNESNEPQNPDSTSKFEGVVAKMVKNGPYLQIPQEELEPEDQYVLQKKLANNEDDFKQDSSNNFKEYYRPKPAPNTPEILCYPMNDHIIDNINNIPICEDASRELYKVPEQEEIEFVDSDEKKS